MVQLQTFGEIADFVVVVRLLETPNGGWSKDCKGHLSDTAEKTVTLLMLWICR